MSFIKKCLHSRAVERTHRFLRNLLHGEEVDYDQFESKIDGTDILTFRENDSQFRLFGTNVHVKVGAYIACAIGFAVTVAFCITYSFYHSRGQGRNVFVDQLELMDLLFAFIIGLPCHILLGIGIYKENKKLFLPFLVFYLTNFILNCVFTMLTIGAAIFDAHRRVLGNIRFDLGWTVFQILFTSAQGLAIYVVTRCRKYVNAKQHFKRVSEESSRASSIMTDAVSLG